MAEAAENQESVDGGPAPAALTLVLRRTLLNARLILIGIAILPFAAWPVSAQQRTYSVDQIQAGSRLYLGQCQLCHAANGEGVAGVNLATQQFPTVVSDDDIRRTITQGNPKGMPPFTFKPEELDGLVAFVRSGMDPTGISFALGEAKRGAVVYRAAGCAGCHRIAGSGARTGPDLTDIGLLRRPSQILRSLYDPNSGMMPINRPVTIVTNDGQTISGRRFDEDTFSVRLIDREEHIRSIQKSDIRRYDISQTSAMPSYREKLQADQTADLLAYLISLKG